jgi:3-deoxy-D-manno-octulosonate 8-phosphate phosphatase (KDO 8-P phosphatase)
MTNPSTDLDQVRSIAAGIRLLALDVDGVLTDGRLYFDAKGDECKVFHSRDGYGIRRILECGIDVALISGRKSIPVEKRADELGIRYVHLGIADKPAVVEQLLSKIGCGWDSVAYIGDDVPDLECMRLAGLAVAVADGHRDLDAVANWRTKIGGGRGAVREVCDLILAARNATGDS